MVCVTIRKEAVQGGAAFAFVSVCHASHAYHILYNVHKEVCRDSLSGSTAHGSLLGTLPHKLLNTSTLSGLGGGG